MDTEKTKHAAAGSAEKYWIILAVLFCAALMTAGGYYWIYSRAHESTDDAAIEARVIPVSSKVSGQVLRVYIDDNRRVKKGEMLVEIDSRDYQVKYGQAKAELDAAQADAKRAADDAERYRKLVERDQISRQTYEKAAADSSVLKAKAELASKRLDAAALDLSYTRITAPESGQVTRKAVETRAFVQVGQPLMAVVPSEVWVLANFKETQLTRMHPGQQVTVKVDAFPGRELKGHIDSVQSGTGARFSLLPAENATGNFVKVVQRVPVKIVFDEPPTDLMLVPGMSVEPTVHIK